MSRITTDIVKSLRKSLQASDRKTSAYDTQATIRRIEDGVAWVHIPGGVDETPVQLTINAKEGDQVQVRVSGGRAFLVGNATAPPTDNAYARQVNRTLTNEISNTNTVVKGVQKVVQAVKKIADNTNQYFWHVEEGTDTGAHITEIPQEEFLADPEHGGGNLLARSNGVAVRDGLTELATFGASESRIGKANDRNVRITEEAVHIQDGTDTLAYFGEETEIGKDGESKIYLSPEKGFSISGGDNVLRYMNVVPPVLDGRDPTWSMDTEYSPRASLPLVYEINAAFIEGEYLEIQCNLYNTSTGTITNYVAGFYAGTSAVRYDGNISFKYDARKSTCTISNTGTQNLTVDKVFEAGVRRVATDNGYFYFGEHNKNVKGGLWSAAFGYDTYAPGKYAFAAGAETKASGYAATALGNQTKASGQNQLVIGHSNEEDTANQFAFIVGNGYSVDTTPSGPLNILTVDWLGNLTLFGRLSQKKEAVTFSRTDNSYVNATNFGRITGYRIGDIVVVDMNLALSTALPKSSESVVIGTVQGMTFKQNARMMVPAGNSGNTGVALVEITAGGYIRLYNYSNTTIPSGSWLRCNLTLVVN